MCRGPFHLAEIYSWYEHQMILPSAEFSDDDGANWASIVYLRRLNGRHRPFQFNERGQLQRTSQIDRMRAAIEAEKAEIARLEEENEWAQHELTNEELHLEEMREIEANENERMMTVRNEQSTLTEETTDATGEQPLAVFTDESPLIMASEADTVEPAAAVELPAEPVPNDETSRAQQIEDESAGVVDAERVEKQRKPRKTRSDKAGEPQKDTKPKQPQWGLQVHSMDSILNDPYTVTHFHGEADIALLLLQFSLITFIMSYAPHVMIGFVIVGLLMWKLHWNHKGRLYWYFYDRVAQMLIAREATRAANVQRHEF